MNTGLRYYTADQVLAWWRSYSYGAVDADKGFSAPNGYPSATIKLDPVASGLKHDHAWAAYNHVERFFARNIEWHHCKAHLLMGKPSPVDEVFARWYEQHPLMHTSAPIAEAPRRHYPEMVVHSLAEAIRLHNEQCRPEHRRTVRAANMAYKEGRLSVWEVGRTRHCRVIDIRHWVGCASELDEEKLGEMRKSGVLA
jgi:hypothetical protein